MKEPHGGELINRLVAGERAVELEREARRLPVVRLNPFELSDLEMLAIGGFSPLEGFMTRADYDSVLRDMRLANGLPWSLPITLAVPSDVAASLRGRPRVALADGAGEPLAILGVQETFTYNREAEARAIFRTLEAKHPGVAYLATRGDHLIGGPVEVFRRPNSGNHARYRLTPAQTRQAFAERGWRTIVGFQTRNPVHRAHEYIQKTALEIVDGLLLHPIAGETKSDDVSLDVRLRCYEVLLENYYPRDRVLLALNPASMRYAGPREAIFHALVRKNFGCTHFIVGRDHAGVGNYYGPYDAQKIFEEFQPGELGITPLFFENTFYCRQCAGMASPKTCGHGPAARVILSGTQVRALLRGGGQLPVEFTRPEVAEVLHQAYQEFAAGKQLAGRQPLSESTSEYARYLSDLTIVLANLPLEDAHRAADILFKAYQNDRTVFLFGNGGSAALASHLATDLGKGTHFPGPPALKNVRRFKAVSLTDNVAMMTAWSNDLSYEQVFAGQLENFIRARDVAFGISSSGNSPNVLRALELARRVGAITIGLTGCGGGKMKGLLDCPIIVPSNHVQHVEDAHLVLAHLIFLDLKARIEASAPGPSAKP